MGSTAVIRQSRWRHAQRNCRINLSLPHKGKVVSAWRHRLFLITETLTMFALLEPCFSTIKLTLVVVSVFCYWFRSNGIALPRLWQCEQVVHTNNSALLQNLGSPAISNHSLIYFIFEFRYFVFSHYVLSIKN